MPLASATMRQGCSSVEDRKSTEAQPQVQRPTTCRFRTWAATPDTDGSVVATASIRSTTAASSSEMDLALNWLSATLPPEALMPPSRDGSVGTTARRPPPAETRGRYGHDGWPRPHATQGVSGVGAGRSIREAQRLVAIAPPERQGRSGLARRWLRQFPGSQAVDRTLTMPLPGPSPIVERGQAGRTTKPGSECNFFPVCPTPHPPARGNRTLTPVFSSDPGFFAPQATKKPRAGGAFCSRPCFSTCQEVVGGTGFEPVTPTMSR